MRKKRELSDEAQLFLAVVGPFLVAGAIIVALVVALVICANS